MSDRLRLLLGGAPTCGTTALLHYLAQHPAVRVPVLREMPYFARDVEYQRGWPTALERYFPGYQADGEALVGKHVMAMYSRAALDRVAQHDERLVLVLVLRNPVDRAYSHYWYARQRGWESGSTFEAALARTEATNGEVGGRGSALAYLSIGSYAQHVERAMEAMGEERTSIVLASEVRESTTQVVQRCFDRIGVDSSIEPNIESRHNRTVRARSERAARLVYRVQREGSPLRRTVGQVVPASVAYRVRYAFNRLNAGSSTIPDMEARTRARLIEHFAPGNDVLARLIDRDLTSWNS